MKAFLSNETSEAERTFVSTILGRDVAARSEALRILGESEPHSLPGPDSPRISPANSFATLSWLASRGPAVDDRRRGIRNTSDAPGHQSRFRDALIERLAAFVANEGGRT